MNNTVNEFLEKYYKSISEHERFLFLPRDVELQKKTIEELSYLIQECIKYKNVAIEDSDENAANQLLSVQCMINAIRFEQKMWIDLKQEQWGTAWDALIDSENYAESAKAAHELSTKIGTNEYLYKLKLYQGLIFPPQVFHSPSIIIENYICSLCEQDYANCDHVAGEAYWGRFCRRIPNETVGTREVSIVKDPKDKKARIFEIGTEEGNLRDYMTWKETELPEEERNHERVTRGIVMTPSDTTVDFSDYFPE